MRISHCLRMSNTATLKTFTKKQWSEMILVSLPTKTSGQIRSQNGSRYEWKSGGKRVIASQLSKP